MLIVFETVKQFLFTYTESYGMEFGTITFNSTCDSMENMVNWLICWGISTNEMSRFIWFAMKSIVMWIWNQTAKRISEVLMVDTSFELI